MKRTILPVLVLSLFGFTAAGAFPALQKPQSNSSDLIEVGHKGKGHGGKHHNRHHNKQAFKHGGKYYHGNRYWTHRYRYRPIGWRAYGCIDVGPVWYCP